MPGCHTQTHMLWHTYTHTDTHTRLLSGKQSQRHGVTETKPQKRRLALCDNPLTHIYIQGLEYASVPPSPPPAARCFAPLLQLLRCHPLSPLRSTFGPSTSFARSPPAISPSAPSFTRRVPKLSPCSDSSVYYRWIVHGLAWQLP